MKTVSRGKSLLNANFFRKTHCTMESFSQIDNHWQGYWLTNEIIISNTQFGQHYNKFGLHKSFISWTNCRINMRFHSYTNPHPPLRPAADQLSSQVPICPPPSFHNVFGLALAGPRPLESGVGVAAVMAALNRMVHSVSQVWTGLVFQNPKLLSWKLHCVSEGWLGRASQIYGEPLVCRYLLSIVHPSYESHCS